jgi:hypothetical protein
MTVEEVKKIKYNNPPFKIRSISKKGGNLIINHKVIVQIAEIASYYKTNIDISICEAGVEKGVLCFTKELGLVDWNALTEDQFIVFLNEADYITRNDPYKFNHNYIVIEESFYDEYLSKYKETSAVWGGFNHFGSSMSGYNKAVAQIDLLNVDLKMGIFKENAQRAIMQPFAFERFLKMYHLLELRFDSEILNEIKALDLDTEPEKIGRIYLSLHVRDELDRLEYIFEKGCTNIDSIVQLLDNIKFHSDIAEQMFYIFGKSSNPIKELSKFNAIIPLGFSEQNLRANKIGFQDYNKFILKLSAYWIYRIRCSIAHNKIGEYIMSYKDENFIVEFAEPLLRDIIKQTFKS